MNFLNDRKCALKLTCMFLLSFALSAPAHANTSATNETPAAQNVVTDASGKNSGDSASPVLNDTVVSPSAAQSPSTIRPVSTGTKPSVSSQFASLLGGLVLIIGLILALSWFVKRFSQGGFTQNATMKILSTLPLGTRERLMLVDVGGKQILLGITQTQINSLHVFDQPIIETSKPAQASSEFSQKLMAILSQKNLGDANDSVGKNTNNN